MRHEEELILQMLLSSLIGIYFENTPIPLCALRHPKTSMLGVVLQLSGLNVDIKKDSFNYIYI